MANTSVITNDTNAVFYFDGDINVILTIIAVNEFNMSSDDIPVAIFQTPELRKSNISYYYSSEVRFNITSLYSRSVI